MSKSKKLTIGKVADDLGVSRYTVKKLLAKHRCDLGNLLTIYDGEALRDVFVTIDGRTVDDVAVQFGATTASVRRWVILHGENLDRYVSSQIAIGNQVNSGTKRIGEAGGIAVPYRIVYRDARRVEIEIDPMTLLVTIRNPVTGRATDRSVFKQHIGRITALLGDVGAISYRRVQRYHDGATVYMMGRECKIALYDGDGDIEIRDGVAHCPRVNTGRVIGGYVTNSAEFVTKTILDKWSRFIPQINGVPIHCDPSLPVWACVDKGGVYINPSLAQFDDRKIECVVMRAVGRHCGIDIDDMIPNWRGLWYGVGAFPYTRLV